MAFLNYNGLKRYDKKTKEYIEDKIKKLNDIDVDELVTKAELDTKANKSDIFSGDYNDLTNKPNIPDTTNLAAKTDLATHTNNDNIHVTSSEKSKWNAKLDNTDLKDYATKVYVTDEIAKASTSGKVDLSGYAKTVDVNASLSNKVDKVTGKSLISNTEIARLATINNYDDTDIRNALNKKANKTELFSGSYNDLTDKPTIPDVSSLASKAELKNHTDDTGIHITSSERTKWNNKLDNTDLTNYATKTYVTDEIAKAATGGKVDLSGYAKTADVNAGLSNKVDKVEGKSLISNAEITRLAQVDNYDDTDIKRSINAKASTADLNSHTSNNSVHITSAERTKWNNKAEMSDIPSLTNYATKTYVTDEIAKAATSGTVDLTGYAKTADVNSALDAKVDKVHGKSLVDDAEIYRLSKVSNYDDSSIKTSITNINSKLDTKANKSELFSKSYNDLTDKPTIPSLDGYATKTYVTDEINKASLSGGTVDLSGYAKTADLNAHTSDTNIHITSAEKTKLNEADNKIEALKTSQYSKYEGTDKICNNTLASRTSDMLIKGKTYVNLGTGGLESAGEKENKISILSNNNKSEDDVDYKQDKKEILLPIEGGLKSLSNGVYDTIEQRADGVYLVQKVKKTPLYGSSVNFNYPQEQNSTNTVLVYFTNTHDAIPNTNNILCNAIKSCDAVHDIWSSSFNEEGVILNYKSDLLMRINKSRLNTVDYNGIKKFINDNQLTVYYALKTPIETKLDINNLDLEVYKDTTYVTTNNTVQPTLSFKVPSNIGGVIQGNAQNINKLYKHKVDKVDGKGLSTNDYTTEEKTKVSKIVTSGDGTTFLANDGTYKKVSSSASAAVAERKFKPSFGFDTYWGEIKDTKGNKNQVDLATIKKQIDQCEEMKVDKIICTLHIAWNETTNSLVIAENTDSLLSAISYCADKNVTIDTVKVHMQLKGTSTSINNYVNNTIGMSTFKTKYKSMLTTICNLFKNTTVTRITILNEMWYITNSSLGHSTFINECLNLVKNAGYSTGITMAGFTSNQKLADAVIQNIDTFYINVYPGISGSGKYITKQEAIEAFSQCDIDLWIGKLKKKYPNKKVIISEMGTNDYWECLAAPSSWDVTGATKTGGYAVDTYITAMMEFFIRNNVDIEELWWWYDLYYAPVKETLLNYLGGDR